MASTCRATAAQATIRFLKNQYLERNGIEHQFFLGLLGIFGHGTQTSRIFVFLRLASRSPIQASGGSGRRGVNVCLSGLQPLSQCTELRAQTVQSEPG